MNKKKYLSLLPLAVFAVVVTIMIFSISGIADNTKETTKYLAFGDSIAAGYGLEGYNDIKKSIPPDSYQAIVGQFLNTTPINYAVTGDDSEDLMDLLVSGKADDDLNKADVITLSIGSNDLLGPLLEIVKETYGISDGAVGGTGYTSLEEYFSSLDMGSILKLLDVTKGLADKLKDNEVLHKKAQEFSEQFEKILELIKDKAPDAELYVTNIYNPFREVNVLGEMAETYIQEINQVFKGDSDKYTLIDAYTAFSKGNFVNVKFDLSDIKSTNLDPHPSKEGHTLIAGMIKDAMRAKNAPSVPIIKKVTSSRKNSIIITLSCLSENSGYCIKYAESKNGDYKTLSNILKDKAKIKSDVLKEGKTYYIKVQSYNEIKGVKYYSGYSKVKKVKIKK